MTQSHLPIYKIDVQYDHESQMFVALSNDIPGLATEASTLPELIKRVELIAPELLELNDGDDVPEYLAFKTEDIYVPYTSSVSEYRG